jgi:hypothetical protein
MNSWLKLLFQVGPMILGGIPATARYAPIIVDAVATAEQLATASGAEKKKHALELVDVGVAAINASTTEHKVDPDVARTIAALAIDPLVTTVNAWSKSPLPDAAGDQAHR